MNLYNEAYTFMLIIFSRTNKMLMFKDPEEAVLKMGRSDKEGTDILFKRPFVHNSIPARTCRFGICPCKFVNICKHDC